MGQYTSYFLYQKYVKYGSQDWLPVYPNVFSADADGTMPPSAKTEYDPACGFIPCDAEYKWVEVPISEDYICDDCQLPQPDIETRWYDAGGYLCSGTTKYQKLVLQASYDSGNTWSSVSPEYSKLGNKIEDNSTDCGYEYPRFRGTYSDGSVYEVQYTCTQQSTSTCYLVRNDISEHYMPISKLTDAEFWHGSEIEGDVLAMATSLSSVTFNAKEGFGAYAFYGCDKIKNITVGVNGVNYNGLGSFSFANCTGLTSFTVTNTTYQETPISTGTFYNCINLKEIDLSKLIIYGGTSYNGYWNAGAFMFKDCISLKNATINISGYHYQGSTSNVNYVADGMFEGCESLSAVTIIAGSETSETSTLSIKNRAFLGCQNLVDINLEPTGVSSLTVSNIGKYAFYGCANFTGISSESEVTFGKVDDYAFAGCSSLSSIMINSSIGNYAFSGCSSLSSITINSANVVGDYAFTGCTGLSSITFTQTTPPSFGIGVFDGTTCPIYVPCSVIGDYITVLNEYINRIQGIPPCDWQGIKLERRYMSGDINYIGCNSSAETLTSGNVRSYSSYTQISSVTIGDCVTSIGDNGFQGCSGLTSITVPDNVTTIGNNCFGGCTGLRTVTIGSGTTQIGNYAFYNCSGLTSIICYATTPPSFTGSSPKYPFYGCTSLRTIYVPASSITAYDHDAYWGDYNIRAIS